MEYIKIGYLIFEVVLPERQKQFQRLYCCGNKPVPLIKAGCTVTFGVYKQPGAANRLRRCAGSVDGVRQKQPSQALPLHTNTHRQAPQPRHRHLAREPFALLGR